MSAPATRRGFGAHKQIADAAKAARGTGYARVLTLEPGEKVLVRFRGLTRPLPAKTEAMLKQMTLRELKALCALWQVYDRPIEEKDDKGNAKPTTANTLIETLITRLIERQTQTEPYTADENYIHNNQAGRRYVTCAKSWDGSQCVACAMRDSGDKRISIKTNANFTVTPHRKYHYIKATSGKKEDNEFVYCPRYGYEPQQHCVYCNRGDEPKQEGSKRFCFAPSYAQGVEACAARIAKKCAACQGIGSIVHLCWSCSNPECGEPFENLTQQLDPNNPAELVCSACKERVIPVEEVKCTRGCVEARRGQLFDTDVLVERLGGGKGTTYSFTEQYPFTPLDPEMLRFRVFNWEALLKPGDTDQQCRLIGQRVNPFTGKPVGAAGPVGNQSVSYEDDGQGADTGGDAGEPVDVSY